MTMNNNTYLYEPKTSINSIKELNHELERARLHQKFLNEIIQKDKELVKDSLRIENLIQTGLNSFMSKGFSSSENSENKQNSTLMTLAKWLMLFFFKK